jgi:hypothetical protein
MTAATTSPPAAAREVALAAELVAAYLAVGRPLMLHWGANGEEVPVVQSTRSGLRVTRFEPGRIAVHA